LKKPQFSNKKKKESSKSVAQFFESTQIPMEKSGKAKIHAEYYRKKSIKLKSLLKNTKIFLNMVIHDLRNPAN
jgi:hypothetical protein